MSGTAEVYTTATLSPSKLDLLATPDLAPSVR